MNLRENVRTITTSTTDRIKLALEGIVGTEGSRYPLGHRMSVRHSDIYTTDICGQSEHGFLISCSHLTGALFWDFMGLQTRR